MSPDLTELLAGGPLAPEILERLRAIDRAELREVLGQYLPDDELAALERRLDALVGSSVE